ncbi:MAG: phytanoyl-CoA dioxygenase family protein [Pseudomonadaceae bacterium]|nr:phytanoyl-CoA dioxygenase family protein [Pseudomonadaceae bacterium]
MTNPLASPAPDAASQQRWQQQTRPWLGEAGFARLREEFDEQGYVIVPSVLDGESVQALRAAIEPHMRHTGRNNFEGERSNRVYALLAKAPELISDLVTHPLPLALAEAELGDSALLSACLAINLLPGESEQPWHHDDAQIEIPLPRPNFGVSAFWALDELTERNGATEFYPGSHRWSEADCARPPCEFDKAIMPAGSLMLAKGTLRHRGGANRSQAPRLIITPQYCAGWARQIENMMAAVPRHIARRLPERVRQLMGYSTHAAFMGYVDGVHPDRLLT